MSLVKPFAMWFVPDDEKRKRKVTSDAPLCLPWGMSTPAPSQQVRCLVRSSASSAFPLAIDTVIVLGHMSGKARVPRDGGEERRVSNFRSPVGGVAASVSVGATWLA